MGNLAEDTNGNSHENNVQSPENDEKLLISEGYLRKRYKTSRYMGSWRYCIRSGNRLLWYMTQGNARLNYGLRGEVIVAGIEDWDGKGKLHVYPNAFRIITSRGKILLCCAPTDAEKYQWMEALRWSMKYPIEDCFADLQLPYENKEAGLGFIGANSVTAAGVGGAVGTMVVPVVGTAIGAAVFASFAFLTSTKYSKECIRAAAARQINPEELLKEKECTNCGVIFQNISNRRFFCHCCGGAFCWEDCKYLVLTPQLGYRQPKPSCYNCFRRQDFISYVSLFSSYMVTLYQKGGTKTLEDQNDAEDTKKISNLLNSKLSLSNTIKLLYKTRNNANHFIVVWRHLPYFVENFIDDLEGVWYQIIHLFQCLPRDIDKSFWQQYCIIRFIRAVCRRCPRIALQTIWQVHAAFGDSTSSRTNSVLTLFGIVYSMESEQTGLWNDLVLAECPEHQQVAIRSALKQCYPAFEAIESTENPSEMETWLNADSIEEFEACARDSYSIDSPELEHKSNVVYKSLEIQDCTMVKDLVSEQVRFARTLTEISDLLRYILPIENRAKRLEMELDTLNSTLSSMALYPLCTASDDLYRVIRIPPKEGKVFTTKERAPTLICIEAVPIDSSNSKELMAFNSRNKHDGQNRFSLSSSIESEAHGTSDNASVISSCISDSGESTSNSSPNSNPVLDDISETDDEIHNSYEPDIGRFDEMIYDSSVYGESWAEKKDRIQKESPVGNMPGWKLFSVIIKTNDDLRQEMFAMQMIKKIGEIFSANQLDLWLRPYRIISTGADVGILETITDACSLDHLKKNFKGSNLAEYFATTFGQPTTSRYKAAQRNFIRSMAAYSIVSYVLQVKDRHNGNILLSSDGHIIHIDFGFILGIAPGGVFSLEKNAPFKLTSEMVEVMGGVNSDGFQRYLKLICSGFKALEKNHSELLTLISTTGQHSPFPCFNNRRLKRMVLSTRRRLFVGMSKKEIATEVNRLVKKSYASWGTTQYDRYQQRSNNIKA